VDRDLAGNYTHFGIVHHTSIIGVFQALQSRRRRDARSKGRTSRIRPAPPPMRSLCGSAARGKSDICAPRSRHPGPDRAIMRAPICGLSPCIRQMLPRHMPSDPRASETGPMHRVGLAQIERFMLLRRDRKSPLFIAVFRGWVEGARRVATRLYRAFGPQCPPRAATSHPV